MDINSCYQLGYIIKPHGLQGAVSIFIDADSPQVYKTLESVLILRDEQLVPFFISKIKISGQKAIVELEESNSIDDANQLKGAALYLPLEFLPELDDDQYYFHEIIGYQVTDRNHGKLGKVLTVYDAGPQNLLAIDYKGHEVLLPITADTVLKVDKKQGLISVILPEGLLEIYTTDNPHED